MSAAAEALSESHWIAQHLLSSLPAATRLKLRIAYGELRARVVHPLRDACATRGSEEERIALESAARWIRALVADDLVLLSFLRGAEALLLDLEDPRSHLTEVDRARYRRLLSFSARTDRPSEEPLEQPPITPRLRSSPEATWVAIHQGTELSRAPNLSEILDRARALGVDDPLLVWLPAKDASHAAP